MFSFRPQGNREGGAPCMVVSWLLMAARGSRCWVRVGDTPAGLHEGVERVFVTVVPAGRCSPVGCALWHVGCGCPGLWTSRGLQAGPVVAPPRMQRSPARLRRCDVLGPWVGRRPRDPRVAPRVRFVGGGRRPVRSLASVPQVPYQGDQRQVLRCFRLPPCSARDWPARWRAGLLAGPPPPLSISAQAGPRAGRSAACSGASVRRGGSPVSSVASTVGSPRCGWAGGAGGVAALSAGCAASRVWPSGTDVGLGWPPTLPASGRVLPILSAAAGLVTGVPPLGRGTPVGSSHPGAFARGASAWTVACVGSGFGSGFGAGQLPDGVSLGRAAGRAGWSWRC